MPSDAAHDLDLRPTRPGGHRLARCPLCDRHAYGFRGVDGVVVVVSWRHQRACPYVLVARATGANGHRPH